MQYQIFPYNLAGILLAVAGLMLMSRFSYVSTIYSYARSTGRTVREMHDGKALHDGDHYAAALMLPDYPPRRSETEDTDSEAATIFETYYRTWGFRVTGGALVAAAVAVMVVWPFVRQVGNELPLQWEMVETETLVEMAFEGEDESVLAFVTTSGSDLRYHMMLKGDDGAVESFSLTPGKHEWLRLFDDETDRPRVERHESVRYCDSWFACTPLMATRSTEVYVPQSLTRQVAETHVQMESENDEGDAD